MDDDVIFLVFKAYGNPYPIRSFSRESLKQLLETTIGCHGLNIGSATDELSFNKHPWNTPSPSYLAQDVLDLITIRPVLDLYGGKRLAQLLKLLKERKHQRYKVKLAVIRASRKYISLPSWPWCNKDNRIWRKSRPRPLR